MYKNCSIVTVSLFYSLRKHLQYTRVLAIIIYNDNDNNTCSIYFPFSNRNNTVAYLSSVCVLLLRRYRYPYISAKEVHVSLQEVKII